MNPVFFTDRDLGKTFPDILARAGICVEAHHDHFAHDTPDAVWLAEVGFRGWLALTHDQRIRYTPNEVAAVFEHAVGLFVIVGSAPFGELADNFVNSHLKVLEFLASNARPFIARVYRPAKSRATEGKAVPGRVALWKQF